MKSILCNSAEYPNEPASLPNYFFSARMADLENISHRLASVDLDTLQSKNFETILNPDSNPIKKYKTIIDSIPVQKKAETATQAINKSSVKSEVSQPVRIKANREKVTPRKDYITENKSQVKSNAPITHTAALSKESSRKKLKKGKHVTISDCGIGINRQEISKNKYNPQLLGLVFNQFTDLVLLQWEEAADMLIDEIIMEEVMYLNSLEEEEEEEEVEIKNMESIASVDELVLEIERIQEHREAMKKKYLN